MPARTATRTSSTPRGADLAAFAAGAIAALVAIAVAWPGLAALELMSGPVRAGLAAGPAIAAATVAWALMSAAMMGPVAIPAARHVALNSLRRRRHRAVATFFAAFVAVWVVTGLVIWSTLAIWRGAVPQAASPGLLFVVALGVAAGWQLTSWKRSALRSCQRSIPLPPRGWQATLGSARFGAVYAGQCVRSCWALMLVMAVAGQAHLVWTLIITAIVVGERFVGPVRRAPWIVAAGLAVLDLVVLIAIVTGAAGGGPGGPGFLVWVCPIPGAYS